MSEDTELRHRQRFPLLINMFRRFRRPKTLVVSTALLGIVFLLIYYPALHVQLAQTPALVPRNMQEMFGADLKSAYESTNRPGQVYKRMQMFDPFSTVSSNSVGLNGLQKFDCVRAIEGFENAGHVGAPVRRLSDANFVNLTRDCRAFRSIYGYERYGDVTQEERDFPLAFNILLYKEVEQLHVLLRAIYRPHNSYCLHVDGFADPAVYAATKALAGCLDNVFLATKREEITYAGFSRLQPVWQSPSRGVHQAHSTFTNVTSTLPKPAAPWRYLINLPSQQFPLKTNLELVKILKIYNGANDVEGIVGNRMLSGRYKFKHEYRRNALTGRLGIEKTNKPHEPPPHNITVVKGSAYGVFSRAFVQFALEDPRARALLEWSKAVASPDEYYWSTLNHDPILKVPGGYFGAPDSKPWLAVYASWPPRDPCLSGNNVRGVCIFGIKDLPQLVARKELFANKFYMNFEPETLHCLDQWILNKSRAALPMDMSYYRQLAFVKR